ncbi:MAG TPA: hypothetical protein VFL92_13025 [Sphingomonas sp.]|nr:hypothetical protein [Sphingomonas sp.]
MRDNKAFASLSSGLLARKGQARPAMRPQGFGHGQGRPDDLGWNDMGFDPPHHSGPRLPANLSGPSADLPAEAEAPPVVLQQDEIARAFTQTEESAAVAPIVAELKTKAVAPRKPVGARKARKAVNDRAAAVERREGGRKAAFTLRLDAERHLRLRLACAVQNRSAQMLVTEALDRMLSELPDVERLATSLPEAKAAN